MAPAHWRRASPTLSNTAVPHGFGGMPGSRASRASAKSKAEKLCHGTGEVSRCRVCGEKNTGASETWDAAAGTAGLFREVFSAKLSL